MKNQRVMVTGGVGFIVNNLAEKLASAIITPLSKNIKSLYEEPREGNIGHNSADISKAMFFNYESLYSWKTG